MCGLCRSAFQTDLAQHVQHQIRLRIGHARQNPTVFFFFGTQAWPGDAVANAAAFQPTDAGSASAVAAGTKWYPAGVFGRYQQWQIGWGVKNLAILLAFGFKYWGGKFTTRWRLVLHIAEYAVAFVLNAARWWCWLTQLFGDMRDNVDLSSSSASPYLFFLIHK
jgi:hypothetical protein